VAKERYDALMSCQANISLDHNRKFTGQTVQVLVEERSEDGLFSGRTALQAPEVDGLTYIRATRLQPGCMTDVIITDALEYDLVGEAA
jgi:ribosomal protein S12 methylthiotransferase